MLHTDGSHPGLSDEEHSTFRLHIVLVTAPTFLRRLRPQDHVTAIKGSHLLSHAGGYDG